MSKSSASKSKQDKERLQHVMQRLEPWFLFLSVLAILFLPSPKGIWWLVLLGLAIGNALRRWREAWTWFSLESMGEMLRAALWVPGIILLYFTLHSYAPQFVHASPATDKLVGRHELAVDISLPEGNIHRGARLFLRLAQKRGRIDLFGEVHSENDSERALFAFQGVASFGDYIRASLENDQVRIRFRIKSGHIPWHSAAQVLKGQGWITFSATGIPLHVSLQTDQDLSIED